MPQQWQELTVSGTESPDLHASPQQARGRPTYSVYPSAAGLRLHRLAGMALLLVALTPAGAVTGGVTLSPSSLSFGAKVLNSASAGQNVTFTNGQSTAVTITSVVTSLGDYSQTNNCPISPQTLAAGASCTITVVFTPSVLGQRS